MEDDCVLGMADQESHVNRTLKSSRQEGELSRREASKRGHKNAPSGDGEDQHTHTHCTDWRPFWLAAA